MSIQAGYDPAVAPLLFSRMQAAFEGPPREHAATPQGEFLRTLASGLLDYFHSHPSSRDRMMRLDDLIASNRRTLKGKTVYVGVSNFGQRIPRTQHEDPNERRAF